MYPHNAGFYLRTLYLKTYSQIQTDNVNYSVWEFAAFSCKYIFYPHPIDCLCIGNHLIFSKRVDL